MVFSTAFLPNSGNKYFIAACDDGLKLFDFENAVMIQSFPGINSCYCDCVILGDCFELVEPPTWSEVSQDNPMYSYIISRGVEIIECEETSTGMFYLPQKIDQILLSCTKLLTPTKMMENSG
jgi:hypothetical protein